MIDTKRLSGLSFHCFF